MKIKKTKTIVVPKSDPRKGYQKVKRKVWMNPNKYA